MKWQEQKLTDPARYVVIPRTLVFLTHDEDLLLLRGAPTKRLWASKLNGIGGHIEPDETPLAGARREVAEETGLVVDKLILRAIVHIAGRAQAPGVILFAYQGQAPHRQVRASREGSLEWHPLASPPYAEMVADLPALLPRILGGQGDARLIYGRYLSDDADCLCFDFELA